MKETGSTLPTADSGRHAIVVGAGVFGLSGALELLARGWSVQVVEAGPVPHPDAASNDISKIVRMDYGSDVFYSELGELAIDGWKRWNATWGWTPFRQDGFLILAPGPMEPGQFEHDSFHVALERGRRVERMTPGPARARYPAWSVDQYPDGFINFEGGWSPSRLVTEHLVKEVRSAGGQVVLGRVEELLTEGGRPAVRIEGRAPLLADRVIVAAGSWSTVLLPELEDHIWAAGQPVFHFKVDDPEPLRPPHFVTWAAGTSTSGWYGFPALEDGTLKISNHGPGQMLDPREPRVVDPSWDEVFEEFIARALPSVSGAPVVHRRLCVYTDTFDSDFLIDALPDRPGFVVATGGSGHGFKFTPVLGPIIADAVEGHTNRWQSRFGWREPTERRIEPARYAGSS